MAQQTGSLQAFRAPLPPESLEGHGDKEGKARGKKSVGETNLSSLDTISNGYGGGGGGLAVLARGANRLILGAEAISRVTCGCGVTACRCPVLFSMSLLPLLHRILATADR